MIAVFAFLRDQQDRMQQLTRVEHLEERRKLRDLPKTAERYVRRKVRHFFASLKPASAPIPDGSEAIRPRDSGWRQPKIQQLVAWADWFAANKPISRRAFPFRKDRIQVAMVASGGIGDFLKSTHLLGPVSNHFSCEVTLITDQQAADQVVEHNPYVSETLLVPATQDIFVFVDRIRHISVFNLIILWRYNIEYVRPANSIISNDAIESIESNHHELRQMLEKYHSMLVLPRFNYVFAPLSREATRRGLSAIKISVATSGLLHRNPEAITFFPPKKSASRHRRVRGETVRDHP